ncbi:MAG: hypothetical protein F8N36_12140 [Desulfovibrio sp.]|uniref:hypothetical protein n=1 Tax=Desulfovibrio sp. TaxID=885 RepID=UPI00135D346E|nr:hypothetical protein [Desulfovibrio sp.]MTJ93598.1 hypothetical protein [Desulfovibrio sp.]
MNLDPSRNNINGKPDMQSASALSDDFAGFVPAWRRAKLRSLLRQAEEDGRAGAPPEVDAHRALARRQNAGYAVHQGMPYLPSCREVRLWQIIFAWRGSVAGEVYLSREARTAAVTDIHVDFTDRGWSPPGDKQLRRLLDEPLPAALSVSGNVACVAPQIIDVARLREILGALPTPCARRLKDLIRWEERAGRLTVLRPTVMHWLKGSIDGVSPAARRRLRLYCAVNGLSTGGLFTEPGRRAVALFDAIAGIEKINGDAAASAGFTRSLPATSPTSWL